jgi:hypothetical protein
MLRDFWIEIEVDGRKTKVACGPKGKHGGFSMKIYQRNNGVVGEPTEIKGRVIGEQLSLTGSARAEPCGLFSYFHKVTTR